MSPTLTPSPLDLRTAAPFVAPAALCAALLAGLACLLALPIAEVAPRTRAETVPAIARARSFPPAALPSAGPAPAAPSEVAAILARPIFAPSRAAGAPAAAAAEITLLGLAGAGGVSLATLGDRAGATATLRPGESWRGWTLVAAGRGSARLSRGQESLSLRIGVAAPAPTPPGAGAAGPA